jgi:hypothetical protein
MIKWRLNKDMVDKGDILLAPEDIEYIDIDIVNNGEYANTNLSNIAIQ